MTDLEAGPGITVSVRQAMPTTVAPANLAALRAHIGDSLEDQRSRRSTLSSEKAFPARYARAAYLTEALCSLNQLVVDCPLAWWSAADPRSGAPE